MMAYYSKRFILVSNCKVRNELSEFKFELNILVSLEMEQICDKWQKT